MTDIYLITPPQIDDLPAFCAALDTLLDALTIPVLQIRLKDLSASDYIQAAQAITPIAQARGIAVLINDDPHVALACQADGVHIGQDDMDYNSCRELLGEDAIIGVTCHNSKDLAFAAAQAGADYVAFGSVFETTTKDPKTRADLELLTWWSNTIEIPCVAIGGITPDNAQQVIKTGVDFIAVSGGIWNAPDPLAAAKTLSQLCSSPDYQP